jgi:hypothetical protein
MNPNKALTVPVDVVQLTADEALPRLPAGTYLETAPR